MAQPDIETIDLFSKRSDRMVMGMTIAIGVGGALLDIGAHTIPALFGIGSGSASALWGMWIPLCFFTIPTVHYLCRRVKTLEKRIEELERLSVVREAA